MNLKKALHPKVSLTAAAAVLGVAVAAVAASETPAAPPPSIGPANTVVLERNPLRVNADGTVVPPTLKVRVSGQVMSVPDFRGHIRPETLVYVGSASGQSFFRVRGTEQPNCFLLVQSSGVGQLTCGPGPTTTAEVMWEELGDGSVEGAAQLPDGYESAEINGRSVQLTGGVVPFRARVGEILILRATGPMRGPIVQTIDTGAR